MPEEVAATEVIGALGAGEAAGSAAAFYGSADAFAAPLVGAEAAAYGGPSIGMGAGAVGGGAASSLLNSPTAQSAAGSVAGTLASTALTPRARGMARPSVSPVPVMPLPDDLNVQRAKRRSIAAQISRRGRASTILTSDGLSDKLGD